MSLAQIVADVAKSAKVLVIDIERVPGTAYAWDPKTRYLPPSAWITQPRTVCWAARWYGQSKTMFEAEWLNRDRMVEKAWDLYNAAEIVVTYNGIRFDDKHLRSAWIEAEMSPPAPWKAVDLFKVVQQFGWGSKSMDSVSKRLDLKGKSDVYNRDLALAACAGDKAAAKQLREYNVGDIDATITLYDRLRPWISTHPHHLMGTADDRLTCNACWSDDLEPNGTKLAQQIVYRLYRCRNCGANVQGLRHARAAMTRGAR